MSAPILASSLPSPSAPPFRSIVRWCPRAVIIYSFSSAATTPSKSAHPSIHRHTHTLCNPIHSTPPPPTPTQSVSQSHPRQGDSIQDSGWVVRGRERRAKSERWAGLGCGYSRCCVNSRPKRRFSVTRCRDHLSSGEKRAGCADLVTCPWATFLRV